MKTTFGTLFQRDFSLATGAPRSEPLQPLRAAPGAIRIGNQQVIVEPVRYWSKAELDPDFVFIPAKHECAALDMGEVCTCAL